MDSEISSDVASSAPISRTDAIQAAHATPLKDDIFYFSLVTFKVENYLFRMPKHELEEQSHVFRDMFSIPPEEGKGVVEGTSDDNPIHLEAINKEEFKLLLQILYLPKSKDISSSLSLHQCTSLLRLSLMWGFDNIHLIAKNRIRHDLWYRIKAVDKIKLAHDHKVEEWYADAYYEISTRSESLSIEEAQKLGLELSVKIGQVRERVALTRPWRKNITTERAAREAIGEILIPRRAVEQKPIPAKSPWFEEHISGTGSWALRQDFGWDDM